MIYFFSLFRRFNVDCSETESLYSINEKIGSEEPLADEDSLANAQRGQNQAPQPQGQQPSRPQNQPSRTTQNQPQGGQTQPPSDGGQRGRNRPQGNGRRRGQGNRKRPQGGKRPNGGGQRKAQGSQRGVGSASVQSRGQPRRPSPQEIEIVQYDATIPGPEDDDVPLLLADPFRDIEEPLALYGTPNRG